jgi:hypothetical protein
MELIYDDFDDVWMYVERNDHNIELSPRFDTEEDAFFWRSRITNIIKGKE